MSGSRGCGGESRIKKYQSDSRFSVQPVCSTTNHHSDSEPHKFNIHTSQFHLFIAGPPEMMVATVETLGDEASSEEPCMSEKTISPRAGNKPGPQAFSSSWSKLKHQKK